MAFDLGHAVHALRLHIYRRGGCRHRSLQGRAAARDAALDRRLRREAERNGIGVNASHMMVHEVMARALTDAPEDIKHSELQAALASQLRRKLKLREIGHRVSF